MIELIEGFPEGVVAFAAKGRVSREDYESVLVPAVESALARSAAIRCYYELGNEFSGMAPGAAWEDFKVGIGHLARWERVAVVTDIEWIRHAMGIFGFLAPGHYRAFPMSQASEARRWIGER